MTIKITCQDGVVIYSFLDIWQVESFFRGVVHMKKSIFLLRMPNGNLLYICGLCSCKVCDISVNVIADISDDTLATCTFTGICCITGDMEIHILLVLGLLQQGHMYHLGLKKVCQNNLFLHKSATDVNMNNVY